MKPAGKGHLEVLGAALLFSTGGAAIKASVFSGWQVASFRSAVAAAVLMLVLPQTRKAWNRDYFLVALAYSATLVLFVTANKMTTAANTIFLQSAAPVYLVFLGPWLLKEPVRRRDILFLCVMALGMSLFFLGEQAPQVTAPRPLAGNILAAISGVTWAFTLIGLRWLGKRQGNSNPGMATVAMGNVLAFLACLPMALSEPVRGGLTEWLVIAYLGVFQIGLAYVLLTLAVRHLPALQVSMLILLEPALNPVWTWLVHGERVGNLSIAGGLLILGATAGMSVMERSRAARAKA